MNNKLLILFLIMIIFNSCNIDKPPPSMSKYWERDNTTISEKINIMYQCGYPSEVGAGGFGFKTNEIAEMQLCMIKKGFKIKGNDHFCKSYPHLPACEKARKDKLI